MKQNKVTGDTRLNEASVRTTCQGVTDDLKLSSWVSSHPSLDSVQRLVPLALPHHLPLRQSVPTIIPSLYGRLRAIRTD